MTIALIMEFPGVTQEQYEAAGKAVGDPRANGALVHIAGPRKGMARRGSVAVTRGGPKLLWELDCPKRISRRWNTTSSTDSLPRSCTHHG